MSIKSHLSKLTEGILDSSSSSNSVPQRNDKADVTKTSPSLTAPGALAHFSKDYREMETEVSKLKAAQGHPAMIALQDLVTSPYQTRILDESRITELIANLAAHPLSTPVTVRRIERENVACYEVIAGHHRVEAFKRLGRTEISASVISLTDDQAQSLVFYDNLLSPHLSDFEKYLGFTSIKQARQLTLEDLANESGQSKSLIGLILSFGKLAPEVFLTIQKYPNAISASVAQKLTRVHSNKNKRIIKAIELVAEGKLLQSRVIRWIDQTPAKPKVEAISIKLGDDNYADLTRKEGQITIKFTVPDEAKSFEDELLALLNKRVIKGT